MVVDQSWRSEDRRYLVDQVLEEPGVAYRIWDAEGLPIAEARDLAELGRLLAAFGVDFGRMVNVPIDDPWCEQDVLPGRWRFGGLAGGSFGVVVSGS